MQMDKIEEMLHHYTGSSINMCYKIVEEMESEELCHQAETVLNFCDIYGLVEPSGKEKLPEYIGKDSLDELVQRYGDYINSLLDTTLKKAYLTSMGKEEFYRVLWESIAGTDFLSGVEEKAFALFFIAIDQRVPYFQLEPGLTMTNNDFRKYQIENWDVIRKMSFIIQQKFSQRTEESSLLLNELDGLKDQNARAVVLAIVLKIIRDKEAERAKIQGRDS